MMFESAAATRGESLEGPVEDCEAFAARQARLIPKTRDIGVLLIECATECTTGGRISRVRGIRGRTQGKAARSAQVDKHQRFRLG